MEFCKYIFIFIELLKFQYKSVQIVFRDEFDNVIPELPEKYTKQDFKPALDVYQQSLKLLLIWKKERDKERFAKLCRYLVASLDCDSPKISYVGVGMYNNRLLRHFLYITLISPSFKQRICDKMDLSYE